MIPSAGEDLRCETLCNDKWGQSAMKQWKIRKEEQGLVAWSLGRLIGSVATDLCLYLIGYYC